MVKCCDASYPIRKKKKLRKDLKRELANNKIRASLAKTLKQVRRNPNAKLLALSIKALDKAAKKNIIHKNKAARIKSGLAKLKPASARKSSKTSSK
jgi:ribosomal protein S20